MAVADQAQSDKSDLKHHLRWFAQSSALNAYGMLARAGAAINSRWEQRDDVSWLLMATMPNSGSTAIAKLLNHSQHVVELTKSGEGQWLVPAISTPGTRWDPEAPFNEGQLRRVWLSRVPAHPSPSVIFEKSPPNLCRIGKIADALAPMDRKIICLTRDPLATCASWFRRYALAAVIRSWCPEYRGTIQTEADHLRLLGKIYGVRAGYLVKAREIAALTMSYEELTENPQKFVDALQELLPILTDLRADAKVTVKDYEPMALQNLNERQTSRITAEQADAIREGLADYRADIEALGYSI